ncbi:hypothetical protein SNK05_010991 [Fusarium graminearum]|uniref:Chromosome 3, complete genome n=2 Tax=Gibberella zeae TaxID=5518 RepID=A0A1C3YJF1_GIBZE|nr:hypothetical protein FGRA07_01152 [Fusarium graminearum]QCZ42152.1 G-protein-coupled receptor [Fusarium graminearum]SCB64683.1 unnamed protein product [Fusarium graminearum]
MPMPPWLQDEAPGFSTSPWTTPLQALEPRRVKHFTMAQLTPDQTYSIHVATLVIASASILATIVTSFWFFRMRRSFRHDLIMLLIYSDMFKSFWLLLFPAVELVAGKIETDETFCQVSGFFLALSIEASDVSVALISVHTALFIFRGEQGLYPYRKAAYALAAILPVVMASLAFIEGPGYINTGQFCYLPFNPMWKRLALSWIPRYLAFAIILFLCIGIYIYVRVLMSRFGAGNESSRNTLSKMSGFDSLEPIQQPAAAVPPTPTIKYHGLIPSSNTSRRNSFTIAEDPTRPSLSTLNSFNLDMPGGTHAKLHSARMARRGSAQMWMANHGTDLASQSEQAEVDSQSSTGTARWDSDDLIAPTAVYTNYELQNQTPAPPVTRPSFVTRQSSYLSTTATTPSIPNIFTILHRKTVRPETEENDLVLTQSDINAPGTVKTREKILRQLRLLFIYPIVYVVIWILPFIVQLTGYGKGAPYGMRLASIVFLCFHGLVDSLVFCIKEKPWRHSQAYNQIFKRSNLQFWKRRQEAPDVGARVGRTREEMTLDSKFAKQRREQEQAEWELQRQAAQDHRVTRAPDWWDRDD